ncbi:hypothetical protein SAMN06296427_10777 [Moheibacter sediminis]|uniref:VanZ like family protein n=1 Tax=Moheibacter sediminis TaxID=1434700 RepID=A0A1W2BRD7_9FLAO|nr:hypothetical protein SAMN06296427_10777 [Moheibacter sediminis]
MNTIKYEKSNLHIFSLHIVSLLIGSAIYILFRTSTLKIFSWFEAIGINVIESNLRKKSVLISQYFPDWFLYSLPDGLWIFSYVCLMLSIWRKSISKQNTFWISIVPLVAIGSEILQFFGLVQGTFDMVDVLCYLIGFFLPFLILNKSINYKF